MVWQHMDDETDIDEVRSVCVLFSLEMVADYCFRIMEKVSTMPLPAQTKYGTKRDRSAYSGIMAESSESHLVAPPTPAAKKQRAGRVTAAVVLSGCLAAVAGSFMAGRHGTRDALVGRTCSWQWTPHEQGTERRTPFPPLAAAMSCASAVLRTKRTCACWAR